MLFSCYFNLYFVSTFILVNYFSILFAVLFGIPDGKYIQSKAFINDYNSLLFKMIMLDA